MEGPSEKHCAQCNQLKPATAEFFRLLRGALTKHCLPCLEASKLYRIKGHCPHGKQNGVNTSGGVKQPFQKCSETTGISRINFPYSFEEMPKSCL